MAKFTPGPWTIEKHGDGMALFAGADSMHHGFNLVYLREPDWNWEANARLIAAAPELLEALQLLRDMQNGPPVVTQAAKWRKAMDMADSAIRKATHD